MPRKQTNVTTGVRDPDRIPDWAVQYVLIVVCLGQLGVLDEVMGRLRVRRKAGGYVGLDAVLLFILLFTAKVEGGAKGLLEAAKPFTGQLGAVGSRRRMITQPSLSRLLDDVEEDNVDSEFMSWFLLEASGCTSVLQDPTTVTYDSLGNAWHFGDMDGTLMGLRQRGLPEYFDLPDPTRLVDGAYAMSGYAGRKRADVQMCRETLQHAGTGLWLGVWCGPGDGNKRLAVPEAAQTFATLMEEIGSHGRGVLRFDGMYGNWWVVGCCADVSVGYLIRWRSYGLLRKSKIIELLGQAKFERVQDSLSGPVRYAVDLGFLDSPDAKYRTRLICSKYRDDTGDGVGVSIDGWRYELFVTSLPAEGWSAGQVVTAYYGRVGQENRFAQEDNELDLDYLFSKNLPGQVLATIVGLFVWNLQTASGYLLSGNEIPPAPEQPTRKTQLFVDESEYEQTNPLVELLENSIDWSHTLPAGFDWNSGHGLECPTGNQFELKRVRGEALVFRAPFDVCPRCPSRSECTHSTQPRYRRELQIKTKADILADVRHLKARGLKATSPRPSGQHQGVETNDRWTPPADTPAGSLEIVGPYLIPSVLRRGFRHATRLEVLVGVDSSPRPRKPWVVAFTAARRQRRRQTWEERDAWNALPDDADVRIRVNGETEAYAKSVLVGLGVCGADSGDKAA